MIALTAAELVAFLVLALVAGVLLAASCPGLARVARAALAALVRAIEGRPAPDRSRYRPPSPIRRVDRIDPRRGWGA